MKVDLCSPRSYPFNQLDLAGVFGRDVYPRLVDEYFQQLGVVKYKGDGLTIAPRVRFGNLAGPYKLKRIRLPWWVGRSRQYLFAAPRLPREVAVRAARQFVANLYHERMTATGAVVWCDQTTNNLIDADFWFDMFPEALFLHIVRDPLDVAIAHHLQDWAPDDFALTCGIIRDNYARWSEVRSCIPPGSYLELRFEDIVKEPAAAVARICARLDIPVPTAPVASPWPAGATETSRSNLSEEDLQTYRGILGPVAHDLGYPVAHMLPRSGSPPRPRSHAHAPTR